MSGDEMVPKGRVIEIRFAISLPETASRDQVLEWIKDAVGDGGGVDLSNPLLDHEPEAMKEPLLIDTGLVLEESVSSVETGAGETRYRTVGRLVRDMRSPAEVRDWLSGREKRNAMQRNRQSS